MDKEMLEALQASIAKWEKNTKISNIKEAKIWGSSCPLCALSEERSEEFDYCKACPVYEKTGLSECNGTPWIEALSAWEVVGEGFNPLSAFHTAAQAEVDFLKSLLPKESV